MNYRPDAINFNRTTYIPGDTAWPSVPLPFQDTVRSRVGVSSRFHTACPFMFSTVIRTAFTPSGMRNENGLKPFTCTTYEGEIPTTTDNTVSEADALTAGPAALLTTERVRRRTGEYPRVSKRVRSCGTRSNPFVGEGTRARGHHEELRGIRRKLNRLRSGVY